MRINLPFTPDLTGRTAVVTGGAGVLCSVFCRALAQCGANVAILNRTFEKAETLAEDICREGGRTLAVRADVTDRESLAAAHDEVLREFGKCEILINGAGGNDPSATTADELFSADASLQGKSFFDLSGDSFDRVMSLNISGAFLTTQVFAGDMIGSGRGCIINISSMSAVTPLTKIPAYSAAKAGLSNFTEWLAVYFAKTGIRCNAIVPGFFSTAQNAKLLWNEDGSPTERTRKILAATPAGRFGDPQELIGALLFLCDERISGFVTGAMIPVDGGFHAYSGV